MSLMSATPADPRVTTGSFQVVAGRVRPHLDALDVFLRAEVSAFEPELRPLITSCFEHAGKRIRPVLVFLASGKAAPDPALVKVAAVVELVHLATLVHDDILDNADLRHNAVTVSAEHGAPVAVLLGDALFSHALQLAASFPTTSVCRAVAEATRRVCAGEIAQHFFRGRPEIRVEDYDRIIDLKTAELFRVSARLGAEIGGRPAGFLDAAAAVGRHLGIAYQVFDDLADYLGREERIGKTLGTDLASGKFTLPLLLLLDRLPAVDRERLVDGMRRGQVGDVTALGDRLSHLGVADAVRARFEHEIGIAESALLPFAAEPGADGLRACCDFIRSQFGRLG